MDFGRTAVWIAEITAAWAVLFICQIPLRKRKRPVLRTAVFFIKVFLIPAAALLFVAVVWAPAYRCGDVITAVYIALVGDTAASVTEYLIRRVRYKEDRMGGRRACVQKLNGVLSLLFCILFTLYGTMNAMHPVKKTHSWEAEGITREHTFVFMSDIHAGSTQPMETLEHVCREINRKAPEFVILGGDVTDELTSYDEMVMTYRILSDIEAPVYFIYGNHDRQPDSSYTGGRTYSDEELVRAVSTAGIRILSDEYVKVADDLVLLGREDINTGEGRKPWSQLVNPYDGSEALVVADHQPYDEDQLSEEVSVLQLSGHTHAGQLWPLQIIYRLLGLPAYGEFEEAGTRLYVSAGESGWMTPLRTEAHCEWDVITLRPQTPEPD